MASAFGYGAHHMAGFGFGFGFLNFLGTVLFILAIIWLIKFVVRGGRGGPWGGRPHRWQHQQDDAMRTARERFAAGEMSREQYDEVRSGLGGSESTHAGPPRWFGGGDSAMELARLRFAKGELTRDEYETIRKGLTA